MTLEFTASYLEDALPLFRHFKKLADGAMAQVTDEQLYALIDEDANSIAIIMKHMAGNMQSRWTNFLTSDGEKSTRNRDSEFLEPPATRAGLMQMWEQGWDCLFTTLNTLSEADLTRPITIRGERHSVLQAIHRQVAHNSYHCGQIVLLAKHFQHGQWRTLSVAKGRSAEFNRKVLAGEASQR